MTKIAPFRAVTYNPSKVEDIAGVVCPPYDVISPARQQYYHDLNPYNLIHILLGKDKPGEDKYQRSGRYFKDWLKDGVLVQDEKPAIYFYSQQYNIKGEKKTRVGFIALLSLEDKCSATFGHEHTRLEPKEDRLCLLKSVKANLSPIFVLFYDRKRIIQRVYEQHIQNAKPFVNVTDDEKIVHKLWRLDSPEILRDMQEKMQDSDIFIADGHHRYEVSCLYRDLMKKKLGVISGEESFNYTLAYFTDTESRGLTVLPIHRLVKLPLPGNDLMPLLQDFFVVEEAKDKAQFFFLMEKAGKAEHVIGMYKDRKYWLLRLKNIKILDKEIKDNPPESRSLDISILNHIVLKKILGIDPEDKTVVTFSNDSEELLEKASVNHEYTAFFLNPVKIQQIMSVALSHNKMPAKSTYFYPKVLSGLVINKLE